MKNIENCIQLKIDKLISNINPTNNDNNNQQGELNEVTTLISYNHCLDLLDFLQNYSKAQKNELLFQISVIYDILGYSQLSLEYSNESLNLIPNVPTIILFQSGLYASMDRFDEAQKSLLKYKYLIGEDIFNNYVYNIVRIIYYYLLDYEENIILREIDLVETKNQKIYYNNIIFLYIKSKLLIKLSEKYKNVDKKRSLIYKKDSIKYKEIAYNTKQIDAEYLFKNELKRENVSKIIMMIYPHFLEFKPKPLVLYKNEFHVGFGLFYKLFKICKLFQLKIQIIKYKKIYKNNNYIKNNNENAVLNENSLDNILYTIQNENANIDNTNYMNNNNIKECQKKILFLSESNFLQDYIKQKNNSQSGILMPKQNKIVKKNILDKILNNKNNNNKIETNYYIYNDFYSNLNLNEHILKNINLNKEYKEQLFGKDFLLDELSKDVRYNINKSLIKDNSINKSKNSINEENGMNNNNNKISKRRKEKTKNINDKIKLIPSNQNKINSINKKNIDKKDKDKKIKYISINNINNKNEEINNIKYNIIHKNSKISIFNKNSSSYKNLFNSNNINNYNKDNNEPNNIFKKNKDKDLADIKIQRPKIIINDYDNNSKLNANLKQLEKKIKYVKSTNNIFNNVKIFGSQKMNKNRNSNSRVNKEKENNNELTRQNNIYLGLIKNKDLVPLSEFEKIKENPNNIVKYYTNSNEERKIKYIYNDKLNVNKINNYNKNNNDMKIHNKIKINNKNINDEGNIKEMGKYFIKKMESKKRVKKNEEMVNQTERKEDIKLLDKISYVKTINKNKAKKPLLKKLSKESIKDKNEINKERFNTISVKEYDKKTMSNKNSNNYRTYKSLNKIMNNNMHNKIKTYLYCKTMKENNKSENKKRNELSIKEKANFLTINLDLLNNEKFETPRYQKITLFKTSFRSDSNDKKKESVKKMGLTKLGKNSPLYMLKLKKTNKYSKDKISYNGTKSSYNKYINNNMIRMTYYFNNIINTSEFNKDKNILTYRIKNSGTNSSISKNNLKH